MIRDTTGRQEHVCLTFIFFGLFCKLFQCLTFFFYWRNPTRVFCLYRVRLTLPISTAKQRYCVSVWRVGKASKITTSRPCSLISKNKTYYPFGNTLAFALVIIFICIIAYITSIAFLALTENQTFIFRLRNCKSRLATEYQVFCK